MSGDYIKAPDTPKEFWASSVIVALNDVLSEVDCFGRCLLEFTEPCFGFGYDSRLKECYVIDVTVQDATLNANVNAAVEDIDLYVMKGIGLEKGCPDVSNLRG